MKVKLFLRVPRPPAFGLWNSIKKMRRGQMAGAIKTRQVAEEESFESEINDWLRENPGIEVLHVQQSMNSHQTCISVWYDDEQSVSTE